jgi:hypothetical protein
MKSLMLTAIVGVFLANLTTVHAQGSQDEVDQVKQQIIGLAQSFEGQGDPDYSRQKALEPLVQKLLQLAPQPSVVNRLHILYGPWRQVWGAYDYRDDDRGVDPELGTKEIYQVVFEGGYYYNVSYNYKNGDPNEERIGLLRGVFRADEYDHNILRVKFTRYPGAKARIAGKELWELPAIVEAEALPNEITIVPTWIVRLFFGGGALREVYTDSNLRITYGSNGRHFDREFIYIMVRAK